MQKITFAIAAMFVVYGGAFSFTMNLDGCAIIASLGLFCAGFGAARQMKLGYSAALSIAVVAIQVLGYQVAQLRIFGDYSLIPALLSFASFMVKDMELNQLQT